MSAGKFSALHSAFSNRNYAIYISGNSLSLIGFWMQRVAVGWLAWELSESEFWVGAIAFAEISPLIVVGPLFGVWADRFERKKLAVLMQSLMFLQAMALLLALLTDVLGIGLLFSLTLLEGCIQAAYQPVRLSLIPNLVRKQDLISAAAFTAVTFNVARFVGPGIGGLIILWWSAAPAILFNALTYLLIIFAWKYIHLPPRVEDSKPRNSMLRDLHGGYSYVRMKPALFGIFVLMTLVALFARPVTYMLSAFVGTIYQGGPDTFALFTCAVGLGAVLAGLKLSMDGHARGLIRIIMINVALSLLALIWFSSTSNVWLGTFLIFCFGYCITVCSVGSQTLVQNSIDDEMRGRVLSLWVAFTRGAPALGVLLIGWVANHIGLQWPNVIAALICLLLTFPLLRLRGEMRSYFEN